MRGHAVCQRALSWAPTDRLQRLHSSLWLVCVFINLGSLHFGCGRDAKDGAIQPRLAWFLYYLPPLGTESVSCFIGFSKLNSPAHRYLCLRFKLHLAMSPARLEARMDSLLSFPVGLFHPLQHNGLSRRSPSCRPAWSYRLVARFEMSSTAASKLKRVIGLRLDSKR